MLFPSKHLLCIGLLSISALANAFDGISAEFGEGNQTDLIKIAVQKTLDEQYWQSNGNHFAPYLEASLANWKSDDVQNISGQKQNLYDFGFTPVLRWQKDNRLGWYGEAGIGVHYLTDLYDNNQKKASTKFQFGDHIAIGYVFQNKIEIALKFQHFSNASIKKPNPAMNFALIKLGYAF
ncbi:acyloxyacyl hydrolase [Solimicrobium silvestre]|uniref:Lipid A deacylase n=1 Tax=Solimicrobium silvestre TaxID=2099400 RepID=A0A2S9GV74_9BURK|nr:acyloxyacyl hydrolase [Solimicrobium silvestre]PRC91632.1 Lipid A 3-O-deacylase (PagL) [Solimicrobium silvestre]